MEVRVITTLSCPRQCKGCANGQGHIKDAMENVMLDEVPKRADEYIITGGEPLMNWKRTRHIVSELLDYNPHSRFYLYTTEVIPEMPSVINWFNGITYTLHNPLKDDDLDKFESFQCLLSFDWGESKSFRLRIDPNIKDEIGIFPDLWYDVKTITWSNDCPLPEDKLVRVMEVF